MDNQNTFPTKWHNATTDPPKKDGRYLTCKKHKFTGTTPYFEVVDYTNKLFAIDKYNFCDRKGQSGWYGYDLEYGFYEIDDIQYWMELPEVPNELR